MATQQQAQPTISMNATAPEVHVASKFAVSVTATDFCVALGRTRHVFQPNGEGIGAGVEYTHAFSLSPEAAKQLAQILSLTVSKYEQTFGVIPEDPAVVKKLTELSKKPLNTPAAKKAAVRRRTARTK